MSARHPPAPHDAERSWLDARSRSRPRSSPPPAASRPWARLAPTPTQQASGPPATHRQLRAGPDHLAVAASEDHVVADVGIPRVTTWPSTRGTAMQEPVTELDERFSDPGAGGAPWG